MGMSLKICKTCSRPDSCSRAARCLGDECPTCDGKGQLDHPENPSVEKWDCPDCDSTGKADIPICAAMRNNY